MFVLLVLTFSSYALAMIFICVCLAQGLYYIADLVEEQVMLTKRVLRWCIIVVLIAHALMFFLEDLPWFELGLGAFAHLVYSCLLSRFPVVELSSPTFILSAMLAVANHSMWFRYFLLNWYTYAEMFAIFVICVWLVPFGFFVSLSANESTLPYDNPQADERKKRKNVPLLALIFRFTERFLPSRSHASGDLGKSC